MKHRSECGTQSVQGDKTWSALPLAFYRFWHGQLGLKGAGYVIGKIALLAKSLQSFPLRLSEGHSIIVDFRDVSSMSWVNHLLGEEFQEAALIRAITSTIQEKAVVWDVGANCGLFSYLTAQSPRVKQIVFYEPNEHMFRMCCDALQIYPKVSGLNVALSDKGGEADLVVPPGATTLGALQPETLPSAASRLRVRCITGDDLIAQGSPVPDVIKIDTEGHELAVLRGLAETIRKHQPVIFLENLSFNASDFCRLLPSTYEVFSIASPSGSLAKGFNKDLSHNSAFIPRDRRPEI